MMRRWVVYNGYYSVAGWKTHSLFGWTDASFMAIFLPAADNSHFDGIGVTLTACASFKA